MLLFRVYELLVDEVLYGQYNTKTLAIRTVSYDDSKAQAIQLEEGKEMVFVLSRDFAKDQPENQYTIVQGNYYEVAENKLHLPIYSASNENSQNIAELKQMSIKDLRTEIKNIVKSKIQKAPASETRFGKKLGKMITKDSNVLDFEQFKIYDSQINSVQ